jgi:hypothetical protein
MNSMNDTRAPNGHGVSNGTARSETLQTATVDKDASPSSKKKKMKKRHQNNKTPVSAPAESAATATAQATPAEPIDPQPPINAPAAMAIEEPVAAPIEEPVESLRLRMKVWTDHQTAKRYLMPSAFMRDVVNGQPMTDVMYAYAMRDDDTKLVTLTANEWNALPFFYVQEDGPAPRATTRPVDEVTASSYTKTS